MKELLHVYMEEDRLVVQPFVTYKNDPESRQLAEAVGAAVRSVIGDASLLRMRGHDLVRLYLHDDGMLEAEVDAVVRSQKRSRALAMAVAEEVVRVVAGDAAAAEMRHLNGSVRTDVGASTPDGGTQARRHYYLTDQDRPDDGGDHHYDCEAHIEWRAGFERSHRTALGSNPRGDAGESRNERWPRGPGNPRHRGRSGDLP